MDKSVINISMLILIDMEKLFIDSVLTNLIYNVWIKISVSTLATRQESQLIFLSLISQVLLPK